MKCKNCGCDNAKEASRCGCGAKLAVGKQPAKARSAKASARRTARHSATR